MTPRSDCWSWWVGTSAQHSSSAARCAAIPAKTIAFFPGGGKGKMVMLLCGIRPASFRLLYTNTLGKEGGGGGTQREIMFVSIGNSLIVMCI